jgi:SAM-dependent methyltransferase
VSDDTRPIADFFDRECCAELDAGASPLPGSTGVTELLVDALQDAGLAGRTVLEIGAGAGELSRRLLSSGALRGTGIDLSPQSVGSATASAERAGLADRLSYRVGDGAREQLEPHDVVVSQKVVCCYPSPDALLANTLPAARQVYALVLPESRGLIGLATRLVVSVENGMRRLARDGFRAYVHDVRRIDATIRAAGFEPRYRRRHWTWLVLVFARAQSPS